MKLVKPQVECPFMQLSKELIFEILFRLPINSLGTCLLVCKALSSVISNPQFAIDHHKFSNQTKQPLTLALQKHNVISTLVFNGYLDINKGARLVEVQHQFPANEFDYYYYFMIGSCHGLVCIYLKPKSKLRINDDLMFIWNPVTNKRDDIKLPNECGRVFLHEDACWFGYLPSLKEYKIFLSYSVAVEFHDRMYLFSFNTSGWKEIHNHNTDEASMCFARGLNTVFVSEALHCLSERKWVCKFDLIGETFEKMPLLISEPDLLKKCRDVSLGVIGGEDECLSVVVVNPDSGEEEEVVEERKEPTLEVWILKEYANMNSWKMRCRIGLPEGLLSNSKKFLGFTYSGILCYQEEFGLSLVDPMDDPLSFALATNNGREKVYTVNDYVKSLISPFNLST